MTLPSLPCFFSKVELLLSSAEVVCPECCCYVLLLSNESASLLKSGGAPVTSPSYEPVVLLPPSSALCGLNLVLLPCPGYNCFGILFVEECFFLSADSPVVPSPSPPHACAALLVPLSAPDGLPRLLLISALLGKKRYRLTVNCHGSLSLRVWLPLSFIPLSKHRAHSKLKLGVFLLTCELPGGVFPPLI